MSTPGVSITHARTEVPEDSEDADLIQPSDWLDEHVITGALAMVPLSPITVSALLADRALVTMAPTPPVWAAGVAVRVIAAMSGEAGDYYVRFWAEDDQTLTKVAPDDGVTEQRIVVHGQAVWASLVAIDGAGAEFPYQPWAANSGMASDRSVSGGGSFWVATTPGTSGGSEPDWAGAGDTVMDGSVEWTREADVPTSGSLAPYALVLQEPA